MYGPSAARTLYLASAVGHGTTELGAFDHALACVGAANFNLVRLSSVIPPGSVVEPCERLPSGEIGDWGDRLHVVYAAQAAGEPGQEAWAGVGWVRDPVTGRGLFVEHEGLEEHAVRADIKASLDDLQVTRGIDFGEQHSVVVGGSCVGTPICALVLCGFSAVSWRPDSAQRCWPVAPRRQPVRP